MIMRTDWWCVHEDWLVMCHNTDSADWEGEWWLRLWLTWHSLACSCGAFTWMAMTEVAMAASCRCTLSRCESEASDPAPECNTAFIEAKAHKTLSVSYMLSDSYEVDACKCVLTSQAVWWVTEGLRQTPPTAENSMEQEQTRSAQSQNPPCQMQNSWCCKDTVDTRTLKTTSYVMMMFWDCVQKFKVWLDHV